MLFVFRSDIVMRIGGKLMNKKRLSSKSINFYKLYLVNIFITVVFICLISFICSTYSSRMILKNMTAFNEEMVAEKSAALDLSLIHI